MLVSGLRAEGVIFGVISAVLPAVLSIDPDEEEIFSEVAHDIGFALHHLETWAREKAAVAALAQSEQKYRDLVENVAEVIYTLDTSGEYHLFQSCDPGYARVHAGRNDRAAVPELYRSGGQGKDDKGLPGEPSTGKV